MHIKKTLGGIFIFQVNISGTSRRKIEEELLREPSDLVFDSAQSQVKPLIHKALFLLRKQLNIHLQSCIGL